MMTTETSKYTSIWPISMAPVLYRYALTAARATSRSMLGCSTRRLTYAPRRMGQPVKPSTKVVNSQMLLNA